MPDDEPARKARRNPRQVRADLAEAIRRLQAGEITEQEAFRIAREAGADLAEIKQAIKPAGRKNPRPPAHKIRITKNSVTALEPPPEGAPPLVAWDDEVGGLGVRVMPSGTRTFFWQGRTRAGRSIKVRIGRHGRVTPEQARRKARELIAEAELGGDPAERIRGEKQAKRVKRQPERTVADLWREYERRHLPGKRDSSQTADRRIWQRQLERWRGPGRDWALGERPVAAVTREDMEDLHRDLTGRRGPFAANRALALLSTMFRLAVRAQWRPDNPARAGKDFVERNQEQGRERFLTPQEVANLIGVLEAQGDDLAAKAIEFLLLCGARRGEALGATWDQFDLSAGVWTKPPSLTKSGKRHRVPLSDEAVALLAGLPTRAEPGPFTRLPVWQLTRRWFAIRAEAGLTDVRLHDLRHSFASLLASSGLSLPVIGALLGHSQPSTTARYSHLLDDALREAAAKVGQAVRRNGGNVVDLPSKKGAS
jgi:integrase